VPRPFLPHALITVPVIASMPPSVGASFTATESLIVTSEPLDGLLPEENASNLILVGSDVLLSKYNSKKSPAPPLATDAPKPSTICNNASYALISATPNS